MIACVHCGRENPDDARFCNSCGGPLAEAAPAREERKVVTAVFVDLVGSTARAERLDPEDVRAVLRSYHETLRRALEGYGGTVEKFIGDAVVAVYGAPVAHEDDPERAVRAALAARDAIADLNERDETLDLHVRVGVATGEALVSVDARPEAGESMVAGDVMNTAARIQSAAPIDGIIVSGRRTGSPSARSSTASTPPSRRRGSPTPSPSGRRSRHGPASRACSTRRRPRSSGATTSGRCSWGRSRGSASTARRSS